MDKGKIVFWNVDTQKDFMYPQGKLYVLDAEKIADILGEITSFAKTMGIRVISTSDNHNPNSPEISPAPDFVSTFPEHCMAGSEGAEFIPETNPESPLIIDLGKDFPHSDIKSFRNFVFRKDVFDVFAGNNYVDRLLGILNPDTAVVYGVTTNICVNFVVKGLAQRLKNIYVVADAIKELPGLPVPYGEWSELGIKRLTFKEMECLFS